MSKSHLKLGEFNQLGIAKLLGLNPSNFNFWVRSKGHYLPKNTRKNGQLLFWDKEIILDWLAEHGASKICNDVRRSYNNYRKERYRSAGNFLENEDSEYWPMPAETKTDGHVGTLIKAFHIASVRHG